MFPADRFDGMRRRFGGIPAGPCAKDGAWGRPGIRSGHIFVCFYYAVVFHLFHNLEDREGIKIFVMLSV